MAVLPQLHSTLSAGLNRDVSEHFPATVVRLYKQSGSKDKFAVAAQALGFLAELASTVYVYVNDHISSLEAELGEKTGKRDIVSANVPERKKLKPQPILDLEDEIDELPAVKPKKPDAKKVVFKRIKKEDARRIRGGDRQETLPTDPATSNADSGTENGGAKTGEAKTNEAKPGEAKNTSGYKNGAKTDAKSTHGDTNGSDLAISTSAAPADSGSFSFIGEDIDNDREWYNAEEGVIASFDQYEDLERKDVKKPRKPSNRTGGGFDAHGNYVDHDHDDSAASRVLIVSHFLVPPFLKGSEEFLSLELSRSSRSIGPSVNPIKDAESELAVSAKNGSFVIRERKEKHERAQQAKDSVGAPKEEKTEAPVHQQDEAPADYATIQQQRRALPAYSVRDELMRVIAENQIVVVIGETGSGKTTQLTQFLVEEGYTKNMDKDGSRLLVACTQPRRVAAMSVAKRVAEEMGCELGKEVGYTIRFEDRTDARRTRIKYMTEGILLRELLVDPNLERYSCVIMDEAHERTVNTDLLLGLFRRLLRRRRDLKLIVTSATMNADRFTHFFGNAPQFFIPGRTFPVDVYYAKSACADYVEAAVKQVVTIHLGNKKSDGDILVFMTGQEDIEAVVELIHEKLALLENPPPLDIYPIYSSMPADLQKRIFNKQNAERRKVVVATNIAETSLTVDGIRYVVDCGLVKLKLFNPKLGMDALQVVPISLANAQQRSGRAGRTAAGTAYRLYTEQAASPAQMYVQPIPEVQRTNLSSVMLMLKNLKVDNVLDFPFLDRPPQDLLACSLYDLWAMGALANDGRLTPLGEQLTMFPMEPTLAKLIVLSCQDEFRCSAEIVTIVLMLSVPSVFYRPRERADEADAMREKFLVADLDHLTLLNVYTQWEQRGQAPGMTPGRLAAWSGRNFLHHKSLLRAREIRNQLVAIMAQNRYALYTARDDSDVRRCICAAYFQQAARLVKTNGGGRSQAEYANLRQLYMKMYLHPTSALADSGIGAEYVVYDELVLTKREYMQCATAVEGEWLLKYGAIFYGLPDQKKTLDMSLPERTVHEEKRAKPKPKRKVMGSF